MPKFKLLLSLVNFINLNISSQLAYFFIITQNLKKLLRFEDRLADIRRGLPTATIKMSKK